MEASFNLNPKNLMQDFQSKFIYKKINNKSKTLNNITYNTAYNNLNINMEISKPHKQYSYTNTNIKI